MHAIPYRRLAWPHDSTPKAGETPGIPLGKTREKTGGHGSHRNGHTLVGIKQLSKAPSKAACQLKFHALSLIAVHDGGAEMPSSASAHDELNVA